MSSPRDNLDTLVDQARSQVERQGGKPPPAARAPRWKGGLGAALLACGMVALSVSAKPWLFGDSEAVVMHGLLEVARAAREDIEANRGADGALPARVRDPALAIMAEFRPEADGSYRLIVRDGQYSVEMNERGLVVSSRR